MTAIEAHDGRGTSIGPHTPNIDLLAAMAVHELKEPVHAVQSFLSVVLQGRTGPLNDAQVDFLSTATQAARRIVRRIEDFRLVFTDQLPLRLNCQFIDLLEHVHNCSQELRVLSELHGVHLDIKEEHNHGFALTCWADPERVDQILLNLFENAIRYSTPGTSVNVFVRETESGAKAVIMQNTSDADVLGNVDKWFEPFWREDCHPGLTPNGMGLGLAIVNHLVRAHGGTLQTFVRERRVYIGLALPSSADSAVIASREQPDTAFTVNGDFPRQH